MLTIRSTWAPDFDAMATPFSALCAEYATAEDDILTIQLTGGTTFVNPAYAEPDAKGGASGIGLFLTKLIEGDVLT